MMDNKAFRAMWTRLKSCCLHSLTITWGYGLAFAGLAGQFLDTIADALGDPGLKEQITAAVGDTRIAGRILLVISVVTILARLRSIRKAA